VDRRSTIDKEAGRLWFRSLELKKKDKNVIFVNRSGVRKKCGICMQIGTFRKTCPLRPKEYGPEPAPDSAPKSTTAPTPDSALESTIAPTPAVNVPDSAPTTAPKFVTHPASASASELTAPVSATQPAPATV